MVLMFGLLSGVGLFASGSAEGEMMDSGELVFAHLGSEDTAYHKGAMRFGERLDELTDGRFTIEIFPNGTMGDEGELFEQQTVGQLDFSIVNPGKIVEFAPTANIFSIPFMWRDIDHWNSVLGGEIGEEIGNAILEESNVKVIGYFGGGVRNVISRKELTGIESLEGMKLRTNQTEPVIAAWSALGANPVPYAYQEVYTGLQTGAIDGLLNESEWVEIMGFHEVAPYIGQSEHEITVRFFTMAGDTWNQLSADDQDAFMQAAADASEYARELQLEIDMQAFDRLQEEGAIPVEFDKERMQEIVREPVLEAAADLGLADLYTRIQEAQ
jgi:tripartite ATP-independent transporter DctP family solute receptor